MIFNTLILPDYYHSLFEGEQFEKSFPYLIPGDFLYAFAIQNPAGKSYELILKVTDEFSISTDHVFTSEELVREEKIIFSKGLKASASNVRISFQLYKGTGINIQLPVSPIMASSIKNEKQSYLSIANRVKEAFTIKLPLTNNFLENEPKNEDANIEKCLSFLEAEAQLDFVIYNKLFNPDGSKNFIKWKRILYRKIVIFIFRSLTKNKIRKRYFVKIYRNYINIDILAGR